MSTSISKQQAAIVAATLPRVIARRQRFEEARAGHMARRGPFDPSKHRYQITAASIIDMLLDHAGGIAEDGAIAIVPHHGQRHQRMAIEGDHYSAFGDGLAPILRDLLPAEATPEVVAAWGDAYWAITRSLMADAMRLAA
jgi:nitric oxide dioxygenase